MNINYDFVCAETQYRTSKLRREMGKGMPVPSRRVFVRAVIAVGIAVAGVSLPITPAADTADAGLSAGARHHLAMSWQMYEPTWEPNYGLLELVLNGGELVRDDAGEPVTATEGPQ